MVLTDVAKLDALDVDAHTPEAAILRSGRLVIRLNRKVCWLSENHNVLATPNDPSSATRAAGRADGKCLRTATSALVGLNEAYD